MQQSVYPRFFMTCGQYMFIKQKSAKQFEYLNISINDRQVYIYRGHVKTHFPENISLMLRYEMTTPISEELYNRFYYLYEKQQKVSV